MSTSNLSREPVKSLADVMTTLQGMWKVPDRQRDDLLSACRSVARMLGMPPSEIVAEPSSLKAHMDRLVPPSGGSKGNFRNIKSRVNKAVTIAGVATAGKRAKQARLPGWMALMDLVPERYDRAKLTRIATYCSMLGNEPGDVDANLMHDFKVMLASSMVSRDVQVYRDTCLTWNRCSLTVPGWPSVVLDVPNNRDDYSRPMTDFPASFADDANDFIAHLIDDDPFSETSRSPASAVTVRNRRLQIRQLASALVLRGWQIATIRKLADLTEVKAAKAALRFVFDRRDNKGKSGQVHNLAMFLVQLAKYWVHCSPEHIDALQNIRRQVDPGKGGMTARNREKLRSFTDHHNVGLLVDLPAAIANRLKLSKQITYCDAVEMQSALGIAIEMAAPIRAKNLASLRIDTHFTRTSPGPDGLLHLVIPGNEVKNHVRLEFLLSKDVIRLLELYVREYRPLLSNEPGGFLFPATNGGSKTPAHLAVQIQKVILKCTGLSFNLHLFRHLAAMIFLRAAPGEYESVRQLLGHTSTTTTVRSYCDLTPADAVRRYDQMITGHKSTVFSA